MRIFAGVLTTVFLAAIVVSLVVAQTAAQQGEEEGLSHEESLLFVCQDEGSMERQIAHYIKKSHSNTARILASSKDKDDLYLKYSTTTDSGAKMQLVVDTMVSGRNKKTKVITERAIKVVGYFLLPDSAKTPASRAKILELNNKHMKRHFVPGGVYLDKDNDITFQTTINLPGKSIPVHAEMVHDTLSRFATSWDRYYEELARTVDLPKPAKK